MITTILRLFVCVCAFHFSFNGPNFNLDQLNLFRNCFRLCRLWHWSECVKTGPENEKKNYRLPVGFRYQCILPVQNVHHLFRYTHTHTQTLKLKLKSRVLYCNQIQILNQTTIFFSVFIMIQSIRYYNSVIHHHHPHQHLHQHQVNLMPSRDS